MKNKLGLYHKFSIFFLLFAVIGLVCFVGSIILQLKDSGEYRDCKIMTSATLNSYVTQDSGNNVYYFGIYNFYYDGQQYHFVNPTYYAKESRIPETVTIKHNAFTSSDDMKVKVKYDRNIAIPIIYGVVTAILFVLFIIYRQSYKDELLLEQSKTSVKNMDEEIPLDEMEIVASQEEEHL